MPEKQQFKKKRPVIQDTQYVVMLLHKLLVTRQSLLIIWLHNFRLMLGSFHMSLVSFFLDFLAQNNCTIGCGQKGFFILSDNSYSLSNYVETTLCDTTLQMYYNNIELRKGLAIFCTVRWHNLSKKREGQILQIKSITLSPFQDCYIFY